MIVAVTFTVTFDFTATFGGLATPHYSAIPVLCLRWSTLFGPDHLVYPELGTDAPVALQAPSNDLGKSGKIQREKKKTWKGNNALLESPKRASR